MAVEILEFSPGAYVWCAGHLPSDCSPSCPAFEAGSELPLHPETVVTLRVALGLSAPDDAGALVARHVEHLAAMTAEAERILAEAASGAPHPGGPPDIAAGVAVVAQVKVALESSVAELAEVGYPDAARYVLPALALVPSLDRHIALGRELFGAANEEDEELPVRPSFVRTRAYRPLNW